MLINYEGSLATPSPWKRDCRNWRQNCRACSLIGLTGLSMPWTRRAPQPRDILITLGCNLPAPVVCYSPALDSSFCNFPKFLQKSGQSMTQQLVRGTPTGPLAAFADRLPPMIAAADDRTAWRFVDFLRRHHPQPQHPRGLLPGGHAVHGLVRAAGAPPARCHQAHPRRGLRRAAPPLTPLGQAAPLGNQQLLRLDGLGRHPRGQPGDVGPATAARRQGRQDPGPQ